jgi:thiol-disulfide isomerase/thioredoxin
MVMRYIIFLIITAGCVATGRAQKVPYEFPEIGKPCPTFLLSNVEDYAKSSVTNAALKGQHFILYFWSHLCSACPASFPKTAALQNEYQKKLRIFLVGDEDKRGRMKAIYRKLDDTFDLGLTHSFDSTLYKRFVHHAVPHLVWVNSQGVVEAITDASALTAANVDNFVSGKPFASYDRSYAADMRRNSSLQDTVESRASLVPDKDLLYQSRLSRYDPSDAFYGIYENVYRGVQNEKMINGCATLERLYKMAYFGHAYWMENDSVYTRYYPAIRYELKDTTVFAGDMPSGRGYYCYSLTVPPDKMDPKYLMQLMRKDLDQYFGYEVSVETMDMPYWRVELSEHGKKTLVSRSNDKSNDRIEPAEIRLTNVSMGNLLSNVFYKHIQDKPPIIDKTGMTANVDLDIHGNFYDMDQLRAILKKKGIIVTLDKMPFKVLIVGEKRSGT